MWWGRGHYFWTQLRRGPKFSSVYWTRATRFHQLGLHLGETQNTEIRGNLKPNSYTVKWTEYKKFNRGFLAVTSSVKLFCNLAVTQATSWTYFSTHKWDLGSRLTVLTQTIPLSWIHNFVSTISWGNSCPQPMVKSAFLSTIYFPDDYCFLYWLLSSFSKISYSFCHKLRLPVYKTKEVYQRH